MIQQLIANSLISASTYASVGIGFGLIFRTARFLHFAHAMLFTIAAYFVFVLTEWATCPLFFAVPIAILLSASLGWAMHVVIYRPLRVRGSSSLTLLIASLGIYIVLQNIVSIVFGDDSKTIRSSAVKEGIRIMGARITPIQIGIVLVSVTLVVIVGVLLKRTKMGLAIRAVGDDYELSAIAGVHGDLMIRWTFAIGSALAGLTGILVALDVDMAPTMGLNPLMMGVAAAVIGGAGRVPGTALGALLLALSRHLGVWKISSHWEDMIAFVILLGFLLIRPQGFFGKKVRKATV